MENVNILISDPDIECTLDKLIDDTKLGVADTPETVLSFSEN